MPTSNRLHSFLPQVSNALEIPFWTATWNQALTTKSQILVEVGASQAPELTSGSPARVMVAEDVRGREFRALSGV